MKKIILIQFLIFTTILNSQRILPIDNTKEKTKIFSFYVRIPNTNNLPTILSKSSVNISIAFPSPFLIKPVIFLPSLALIDYYTAPSISH